MTKDKAAPSGQISFRLDPELQVKLYGIAKELSLAVSDLVKAMIAEQLPDWELKAYAMRRKRWAAKYRVKEEYVPLVHVAMLAGLRKGPKDRGKTMRAAVEDVNPLPPADMQAVLVAANHELGHIDLEVEREEGYGPDLVGEFVRGVELDIRGRD